MFLAEPAPAEVFRDKPADFSGMIASADFGMVTLVTLSSRTAVSGGARRTPKLIRRSDPDGYRLVFNRHNTGALTHNGNNATLSPGDLTLIDTSLPFEWRIPGGDYWHAVRIQRELLPLPHHTVRTIIGARLCGKTGIGALLTTLVTKAAQDIDHYRPTDAIRVSTTLLDLLGGLLVHELEADTALPPGSHQRVLFRRIQVFIQQRLGDPALTPETIAAAHCISVRTLHRLFQSHDDTVAGWIRTQRLDRCRQELTNPLLDEQTVQTIAARWGFTAAAHFTRAFRAAYGLSPQEYRRHDDASPAGHASNRPL